MRPARDTSVRSDLSRTSFTPVFTVTVMYTCNARIKSVYSCSLIISLQRLLNIILSSSQESSGFSRACFYCCTANSLPKVGDPEISFESPQICDLQTDARNYRPSFRVKTSPKESFSMTAYERFGLVFTETRVYKFGHESFL
jgi:hypothetical protein